MNENELDIKRFKFVIIFLLLFIVSSFQSCTEIRYKTQGKEQKTKVQGIVERKGKYGNIKGYRILYVYQTENKVNKGDHPIPMSDFSKYSIGQEIEIEYLDETIPKSRIKGSTEYLWIIIFLISVLGSIGFTAKLVVDAKKDLKK